MNDCWFCGWKKLASYLDKSKRTCQRYCKLGMPKHSDPYGNPMFQKTEIDQWIKENENRLNLSRP